MVGNKILGFKIGNNKNKYIKYNDKKYRVWYETNTYYLIGNNKRKKKFKVNKDECETIE